MQKTYDPEVEELIEKLQMSWLTSDRRGDVEVVDGDVAQLAAVMIYKLYNQLQSYEAEHYNQQIGG